ncbi:hypothetical protein TRFO_30915 [Tritrichomonas foetus]|uniref:Uncharacterized protein n=1 Tax=Tritrichomonas foetus TaxID=1144522 RepID=A0A1J4JU95_9EUKA|nr:hypothetical protein TRFO_30915 [Tritrichomonas foetus]|eukprot:OHT02048.1 hypothetical protein TRFO_30915 [Tritrichomonas foetus]
MIFAFIFFVSSQSNWQLISTLRPGIPNKDLFGRSVAICSTQQRVVVGAEWADNPSTNKSRAGALYVYDYDYRGRNWTQKQIIYAEDSDDIEFYGLGSTVEISSDCNTIIAGAPSSNMLSQVSTRQCGAVAIFEYNGAFFEQTHVGKPIEPIEGGGFGRTLAISTDAKYFAAANYNKFSAVEVKFEGQVEVHSNVYDFDKSELRWDRTVLDPPDNLLNGNRYRFGNKIQFLDASTIIISADDLLDLSTSGIYIYKKSFNETTQSTFWRLINDGINASAFGYNNIGESFSMPSTKQDFIALLATNETNTGIIFLTRNDSTDVWEKIYSIDLPQGYFASQLYFCGESYLAATGKYKENRQTSKNVLILFKNVNGKFQFNDSIFEPAEDDTVKLLKKNVQSKSENHTELHLNFLSSFAWDQERCFRFAIGSMSKSMNGSEHIPYEFGRVYVYQASNFGFHHISAHYDLMPIIGTTFFSALLILLLVAVVIFYAIKFKRSRANRNFHANDPSMS